MVIRTRMRSASNFAVVCALGVLGTAVAQTPDRSFHFDITTQSLSQALRNFAHTCGQEVVFTEDVVAGQATSLKGEYTVQGALDRLLQGTDLVAERSTSGAIMIRRRLREIVRKHQRDILDGKWIVTIARASAANVSYEQLEAEWLRLAKRASILAA